MTGGAAADRWRDGLAAWAIPDDVLAAAPVSPWGFSVEGFADRARRQRETPTPAHDRARQALPDGGTVLDVGCGGGAASLPLVPPAGHVTGVDENAAMLEVFREAVEAAGALSATVAGRWPDVADDVAVHDVVVSQDVAYNVPDLAAFARELDRHARRRVVLVLPTVHPMSWTTPYWERLHGLERPTEPTVETAVAVLADLGFDVQRQSWREPTLWSFADPALAVSTSGSGSASPLTGTTRSARHSVRPRCRWNARPGCCGGRRAGRQRASRQIPSGPPGFQAIVRSSTQRRPSRVATAWERVLVAAMMLTTSSRSSTSKA